MRETETNAKAPRARKAFPPWLKVKWPARPDPGTQRILESLHLHTVCQSAECPNRGECFSRRTATFLILGPRCTRHCRFCAVEHGPPIPLDQLADEPDRVARAAQELRLRHVVVTSVTRDDLPDEGAGHFARVIEALRAAGGPELVIEVLVPDFHARDECLGAVLAARPDVFNHNLETVARLQPLIRPQADYRRSLEVLRKVKRFALAQSTKSGLMVGLGETPDEVRAALDDLRAAGCEILTVGQYLSPSPDHYPVAEFVRPEVFDSYREYALKIGFRAAACGPFVRSSYMAEQVWRDAKK
jgi:lipoyl synthase